MRKSKLLVIHISLYNGGAERSLVNFLNYLPKDKYDVDLLLFRREGFYLEQLPEYVRLLEPSDAILNLYHNENSLLAPSAGIKGMYWKGIHVVGTAISRVLAHGNRNLEKQIRWKNVYRYVIPKVKGHYDVAMSYMHGEYSYFLVDKVDADKKLAWVHNDYPKLKHDSRIDLKYYRKIDGIATISDGCVDALKAEFPEISDKFVMLPNLIGEKEIRETAKSETPTDVDVSLPLVLTVGRLSEQKQPDLSVKAAKILMDSGLKFNWYWIGDGGYQKTVEEMIAKYDVGKCFHLLGKRKNPYAYMRLCNVFVQNSAYEGKSVALDEAKILGCPSVLTNYPTAKDQIHDGEGIIVDMSAEAVAEGIKRVLNDQKLSENIRNTLMSRHYGNESEISRYIEWISRKDGMGV